MDSVTWGLNVRSSKDTSSQANILIAVPAGTQLLLHRLRTVFVPLLRCSPALLRLAKSAVRGLR